MKGCDDMANRSKEQLQRQKENYQRLKAAGFSTKEASRLRSASQAKINTAIATGERPPVSEKHQKAARGEKTPNPSAGPYGVHKGRITERDYKDVEKGYTYMYTDRYAYLMTYVVKNKYGEKTRKYYTILSSEKRTKASLKEQVIEDCESQDEGEYPEELIHSSVQLLEAYHNSQFD